MAVESTATSAERRLIKHAGVAEFLPNDNRVSPKQRERKRKRAFGGERLSSLSRKRDRPSGIAKIPRARFVILYTTAGALVSKEWCTRKALSEIRTLHLLPTYPYIRARILSGCLHRYMAIVVVLEMVAIFARSWQEDNETRPDTRYTTTLSWFSPMSLLLSLFLSLSLYLVHSLSSTIHPSTSAVLPVM